MKNSLLKFVTVTMLVFSFAVSVNAAESFKIDDQGKSCTSSNFEDFDFRFQVRWGIVANTDWRETIRIYDINCGKDPSRITMTIPRGNDSDEDDDKIVLTLTMERLADNTVEVSVTRTDYRYLAGNQPQNVTTKVYLISEGGDKIKQRFRGSNYGIAANVDFTLQY